MIVLQWHSTPNNNSRGFLTTVREPLFITSPMQNPPCLLLTSQIVKSLFNDASEEVNRYVFEWAHRTEQGSVLLRIFLFYQDHNNPMAGTGIQLPKLEKSLDMTTVAIPNDARTQRPTTEYEKVGSVYVDVSISEPIAQAFCYYTESVLSTSLAHVGAISHRREDLRYYE